MKTLDKTCCHVYIYPKCLYDNITTLGYIMDKEQALEFVKGEINQYRSIQDQHKRSLQSGYVNGLNSAFLRVGLFTIHEFNELQDLLSAAIIAE